MLTEFSTKQHWTVRSVYTKVQTTGYSQEKQGQSRIFEKKQRLKEPVQFSKTKRMDETKMND